MKPVSSITNSAAKARAAAAEIIALEASRLARLATANQFTLLPYLIDMVVLEAWRETGASDSDAPDTAETLMGADGG